MDKIIAFLAKTLNIAPEQIAELLYQKSDDGILTSDFREDSLSELLALDKQRIAELSKKGAQAHDNGYKRAQAEVSEKWETGIRAALNLPDGLIGEDLIAAAKEAFEKQKPKGKVETDEDVKKHPLFLQTEAAFKRQLEDLARQKDEEFGAYKAKQEGERLRGSAKAKAKEILLSLGPVLEQDAAIVETRIKNFLGEFDSLDFQELENGGFLPIKDGQRLENEHGHPTEFSALAEAIAKRHFVFQKQDPKGQAGNKSHPYAPQQNSTWTGAMPKTSEDLWALHGTLSVEDGEKLLAAWDGANN